MKKVTKYENLKTLLPNLSTVLSESIQQEFLNIQELDLSCSKYSSACINHEALRYTKFVIYSPYISKKDHKYETFIFVNVVGDVICHLSGQEMELYGMIHPISELHESEEYIFSNRKAKNRWEKSPLKASS